MLSTAALKPRLNAADFRQALGQRPVARSMHFSVHYAEPSLANRFHRAPNRPLAVDLSTACAEGDTTAVDECIVSEDIRGPLVWRLGLVLPKKMARRSVTRSLIKHQARELWRLHAPALHEAGWLSPGRPACNWVLRLKAPWDKRVYLSAASAPLRQAVREELLALLAALTAPGVSRKEARP